MEENLSQKLSNLKDDFESKTKELMDNLEDLNKKMDEIDESGSYDDETEQDLESELGDTLDVEDINTAAKEREQQSDKDPEGSEQLDSHKRKQHPQSDNASGDGDGVGDADRDIDKTDFNSGSGDPSKDQSKSGKDVQNQIDQHTQEQLGGDLELTKIGE